LLPKSVFEVAKRLSISNKTKKLVLMDDWNARQSELAVGSGGMYGKGIGRGTQNPLGFLPKKVAPTDFIFSVISEETGFAGSALLLGCCAAMLMLTLHISAKSGDDFGKYLAAGIATVFCVHIFINVGMTIRVVPIIGIPLPFVSYGGSGMIGMMACMGVLQSVYIHRYD
jgi:rod shape determining protein RodA